MRHGSLFSGIGGFDLASEWMGWENIFHCEWNEFGQKVLKYYWPKAITYNDITKTDFTIHRGTIDILTGGFPCQPYSSAGKRLGKEDSRHLWPEMLRTIREIQPTWVVGENVRGLTNWNGGLVFDEVQADLEAEGYEVTPFLLPACAVNAPHRRDRIWFVAFNSKSQRNTKVGGVFEKQDNESIGIRSKKSIVAYSSSASQGAKEFRQIRPEDAEISGEGSQTIHDAIRSNGIEGTTSYSDLYGRDECNGNNEVNTGEGRVNAFGNIDKGNCNGYASNSDSIGHECRKEGECSERGSKSNDKLIKRRNKLPGADFQMFPTCAPICDGDDGLSNRLDSITFPKWRNESIKAGGNAIVPQVVYQIFKAIEQYNQLDKQLSI
jgi:DNA (cytosine-5)-methyltransferase 1